MSPETGGKPLRPLFEPLRGSRDLPAADLAVERQRRLVIAMTEAVSRYGYPDTSLETVITLAGVSKADFYGVFGSKAKCFWATFEILLEGFATDIEALVAAAEGPRRQLEATVEALAQKTEEEPGAVGLVLIDSLALGPAADDPRAHSQLRFEALLGGAVDRAGGKVSESTARGIVIGLRRLAYRTLRDRSAADLAAAAPALADWIIAYAGPTPAEEVPGFEPRESAAPTNGSSIPWAESPRSFDSRVELSARERIMRAVAQLVAEDGYLKLTVPGISTRAGVSNQTFYAEFADKDEALLASFEALVEPTLALIEAAYAEGSGWRERVAAGLAAALDSLAAQPLLTELAFRALPLSGRAGLDRVDKVMERLGAILADPSLPDQPQASEIIIAATIGGTWGMIRTEALAGRGRELATLHHELVGFVTTGLGDD
jgi:AcrR family transcriptional regulator